MGAGQDGGRAGPGEGSEDTMDISTKYVWDVELTRRTSQLWAEDYLATDLCCDDGIVRYTSVHTSRPLENQLSYSSSSSVLLRPAPPKLPRPRATGDVFL